MNPPKQELLTCLTCRVGFKDGNLQRDHYKSDWHRYNLIRKVENLPPVTAENFAERQAAQESKEANDGSDQSKYCTTCRKSFGNEKAYDNHLTSKKHQQLAPPPPPPSTPPKEDQILPDPPVVRGGKKFPTLVPVPAPSILKKQEVQVKAGNEGDEDDDEWDEVEGSPIPPTHCLFCDSEFEDIGSNLEHMIKSHSFFIPDIEYCTDINGLLEYLGAKIGEGFVCIWCNEKGKQFYDLQSVQQHMRDKGHCKMLHEGECVFEYTDFYDYSSSYPDGVDVNPDEAYQMEEACFNDNMQLVLPSGVTLGHRALKIYYKQYVRPGAQVSLQRNSNKSNILSKYKAIGYGNISVNEAQRKFQDQKVFKHARDKYFMKLGISGNKTTQTYFRRQVQF